MPDAIGHFLKEWLQSPMLFLLSVNAALFVIGMFIETSAAIIVPAPILAQVAVHFGIDPVHFGIVMVVNLALGMITPPFGVNLFAARIGGPGSLPRPHHYATGAVRAGGADLPDGDHVPKPQISLFLRDVVYAKGWLVAGAQDSCCQCLWVIGFAKNRIRTGPRWAETGNIDFRAIYRFKPSSDGLFAKKLITLDPLPGQHRVDKGVAHHMMIAALAYTGAPRA